MIVVTIRTTDIQILEEIATSYFELSYRRSTKASNTNIVRVCKFSSVSFTRYT